MSSLTASIEGIGFWASGIPSWQAARDFAAGGALPADAPRRPSPQLLAPNERRRAPETVAVALEVALAACAAAGRDPVDLPSVFASTHGDLAITDYMCATLADDPRAISPTKFHNSVHNAAAGYWTIGNGCMRTTTAISAHRATFAQGLLEAMTQLATDTAAVLLVGYDTAATGLLSTVTHSEGLLGGALVLVRDGEGPRLSASLHDGEAPRADGPLSRRLQHNAMAPMLPLFEALAAGTGTATLPAGGGRRLALDLTRG
ncbi:MAG: beta-ketoacyl synthase chain length factor [Luteimonas sp.]|nr:beta-ketoacyl synthase chain length factor [Luteimonas sp.]